MLLSRLRELRILVVTTHFGNREDSDPIPADKRLQIITSFFESCKNLERNPFFSQFKGLSDVSMGSGIDRHPAYTDLLYRSSSMVGYNVIMEKRSL